MSELRLVQVTNHVGIPVYINPAFVCLIAPHERDARQTIVITLGGPVHIRAEFEDVVAAFEDNETSVVPPNVIDVEKADGEEDDDGLSEQEAQEFLDQQRKGNLQ